MALASNNNKFFCGKIVNFLVWLIYVHLFFLLDPDSILYQMRFLHKLQVRILTDPVPDQQPGSWGVINFKFSQWNI